MLPERAINVPRVSLVFVDSSLSSMARSRLGARDKGPVFWGLLEAIGGTGLKLSNDPGLAIRTACGDDSTLNNYPVSSTDWQLRNGYTEPMAVVWRVQFFNGTSGKNEMSGWMLEHLKAGEVSDGWSVEAGHCKARNVISVQVECAVRDSDEAKCYNSDGNPYPTRPTGAFSGDHNPNLPNSGSTSKANGGLQKASGISYYFLCFNEMTPMYYSAIFQGSVSQSEAQIIDDDYHLPGEDRQKVAEPYVSKFNAWLATHYSGLDPDKTFCHASKTTDTVSQELGSGNQDVIKPSGNRS